MTFKQLMRKMLANLWLRCADLAVDKIKSLSATYPKEAEVWENFFIRCEERILKHSEHVPEAQKEVLNEKPT